MSHLINCLKMVTLLRFHEKTKAEQLAEELGVTTRMVQTYRRHLEEAGIPIQSSGGPTGGYWLEKSHYFPIEKLTEKELHDVIGELRKLNTPLPPSVEVAVGKMKAALDYVRAEDEYLIVVHKTKPSEVVKQDYSKYEKLRYAFLHRREVTIDYRGPLLVHPHGFVVYDNQFYLVAYAPDLCCFRTFKLARVHDITLERTHYELDESFILREHVGHFHLVPESPFEIELIIDELIADQLNERIWGENQTTAYLADGSLHMKVTMQNSIAAVNWILGLGRYAKVIKPQFLIDEIIEEASDLLAHYEVITEQN